MRPRANTISHVDNSTYGIMAGSNSSIPQPDMTFGPGNSSTNGLPRVGHHHYRGMSSASGQHGNPHGLPKLETKNHHINVGVSMRTAPPLACFGETGMEGMMFGPGSTINPAHLHYPHSPQNFGFDPPLSPFHHSFSGFPPRHVSSDGDGNFPWLNNFDQQMSFDDEQAIDTSSPSAIDSASPGDMSEMVLEGVNGSTTSSGWQNPMMSQAPFEQNYAADISAQPVSDMYSRDFWSPKSTNAQMAEYSFSTPPPMALPTSIPVFGGSSLFHSGVKSDTLSNSAASISSSNQQSSITTVSTDSITEATRKTLVNNLSESQDDGTFCLRTNQPQRPPLNTFEDPNEEALPATQDLQRFVAAYIHYFHPHLPFLHVASLSFDAPAFSGSLNIGEHALGQADITGGAGALLLAMAAIGALYEFEFATSKDLFEKAKIMIQLYLEKRRRANVSAILPPNEAEIDAPNTPLWLVQAMLLNVIYGHNCGDKTAAGIANTHCAALMSLARSADLVRPIPGNTAENFQPMKEEDLQSSNNEADASNGYIPYPTLELEAEWVTWKLAEERKRTLYAIFILSSLLVSAYNCAPALMNSELLVNLPCDENLWAAESAEIWCSLGGNSPVCQNEMSFAAALESLLTAGERRQQNQSTMSQSQDSSMKIESLCESDLKPSTFGCLILINALHNFIWENTQRHGDRQWTTQETEAMHAHIEPALRAWQAAWSCHAGHSLERPNPFGATSLSADCIPLLDLAYVRLYVNLGRSKESFFHRDFHAMAEELASGLELVQHVEHSPTSDLCKNSPRTSSPTGEGSDCIKVENDTSALTPTDEAGPSSCALNYFKRERQLRRAAYCAANSLMMSDRLNVTFADFNSRELPLQSALCAFDCAQILAEWVSTLQQRVGPYVGILGKDEIDYNQAPACMILEEDDCKLLEKTREILNSAEIKLGNSVALDTMTDVADFNKHEFEHSGYGSKILAIHARMFEKEATWPSKRNQLSPF